MWLLGQCHMMWKGFSSSYTPPMWPNRTKLKNHATHYSVLAHFYMLM